MGPGSKVVAVLAALASASALFVSLAATSVVPKVKFYCTSLLSIAGACAPKGPPPDLFWYSFYTASFWELAEGFAFSAAFVGCAWVVAAAASRPGAKRVAVADWGKGAASAAVLAGASGFSLVAYENFYWIFHKAESSVWAEFHLSPDPWLARIGLASVGAMGAGTFVLLVGRGLFPALRRTGALLSGLAASFTLALLLFDYHEMTLHATDVTAWSVGGVYLVSNWFVLVVSWAVFGTAACWGWLR